jgi:hypothetical protein
MNKRQKLYCLRKLRGTAFLVFVCLLISCRQLSWAQSEAGAKSGDKTEAQNAVLPLSLRYDEPKTYPIGTKRSAILGDMKCGSDGTIFLPMVNDYTAVANAAKGAGPRPDRMQLFLVTGLTPSGNVVQFAHTDIPGLMNFVPEVRYFVSSSRVYTLEFADIYDPADPTKDLGRAHVILIYDYKGAYQGVIRLEPGLNPINIAAFPSGDLLVVSLDKFNQTTRLLIFDQAGRPVKELKLFDEDYALKLQPGDKEEKPPSPSDPAWTHLALAQWVQFGEDLLMSPMSPIQAHLPLIEISENGVVRSTNVTLPDNASISGIFESSDDKIYHVVASLPNQVQASKGEPLAPQKTSFTPTEIDDIYPVDGSILKRVKFNRGLMPACVRDNGYTFLWPRDDDGKLQTIRGTVIH